MPSRLSSSNDAGVELLVGGGISLWFVAIEGCLNCCVFARLRN